MGMLRAKVGGVWEDVIGGTPAGGAGATGPTGPPGPTAVSADVGNIAVISPTDSLIFVPAGGADEVWVGIDDPNIADPTNTLELWFDPDAPSTPSGAPPLDQATADTLYVKIPGDTMTGALQIAGDASVGVQGQKFWPGGTIDSCCEVNIDAANLRLRRNTGAAVTGKAFQTFLAAATTIGTITIASASTVAYNTSSDPRLKEVVAPITDAATRVQTLGSAAFRGRFIPDAGAGQEWDMLNATDIATVAPYAVQGEATAVKAGGEIDPMQVDFSKLVPLLTAALADALNRIEALEATP